MKSASHEPSTAALLLSTFSHGKMRIHWNYHQNRFNSPGWLPWWQSHYLSYFRSLSHATTSSIMHFHLSCTITPPPPSHECNLDFTHSAYISCVTHVCRLFSWSHSSCTDTTPTTYNTIPPEALFSAAHVT